MEVFVFGVQALLTAFLVHVVVWRMRLPQSHSRALLAIFFGTLVVMLGLRAAYAPVWLPHLAGPWQYVQVTLFHVAFSLAYLDFYTAIEDDSPTLTLLLDLDDAGPAGRSEEELRELIGDHWVVGSRLEAMEGAGVVEQCEGRYRLTQAGRFWNRCFQWGRRVYGLEVGG